MQGAGSSWRAVTRRCWLSCADAFFITTNEGYSLVLSITDPDVALQKLPLGRAQRVAHHNNQT
jgi:hypothetical protein